MVGILLVLMTMGVPVAWSFLFVSIVGAIIWWGGEKGLDQLILSIKDSVCSFTFLPIPLFVLMGEIMFQSGIGFSMIDTLDKWMGRMPGRLGLLAVSAGTVFSVMSGNTMSSTALLGSTLTPDMESRGYKKPMSLGPILGSGGLAMMIPPSSLAVFVAAIGNASIAKTLIGIIIPGLLMAFLYAGYIIIRCWLQPSIAPSYDVTPTSLRDKLVSTVRYVLPLGFIIFAVLGVIFMGIATPTEAAATGALSCYILAVANGKLNWQVLKKSTASTLEITVMIFMIIVAAKAFAGLLTFSGATKGLVQVSLGLPLPPIVLIILIQIVLILVGMVMSVMAVLMVAIPMFMPVITAMGFDPVWFLVILLLNVEMATTSPPYGLSLFVMKNVAPIGTKMGDIYRAGLPFLGCDAIVMALLIAFPPVTLWLPSIMR